MASLALVVGTVFASAIWLDGYALRALGFGRVSAASVAIGLGLAAGFIGLFGPLAAWCLAQLGVAGFEAGLARTASLPLWLLVVSILIVAPAEELLYRAYAIEVLGRLIGNRWLAGLIALTAFMLAHVPMWGWGPSLTTVVSGGVATLVYLVRPDIVALILAHVLTDLVGLVIAPRLTLFFGN